MRNINPDFLEQKSNYISLEAIMKGKFLERISHNSLLTNKIIEIKSEDGKLKQLFCISEKLNDSKFKVLSINSPIDIFFNSESYKPVIVNFTP